MKKFLVGAMCALLCVPLPNWVFAQTTEAPASHVSGEQTLASERAQGENEAAEIDQVQKNEIKVEEVLKEQSNEMTPAANSSEETNTAKQNAAQTDFLIPDNNLREKINGKLGKDKNYAATKEELATIQSLDIIGSSSGTIEIQSFQGIENLTNINRLTVMYASVPADMNIQFGKLTSLTYLMLNTVYIRGEDTVIKDECGKEIRITQTADFSPLGNLKSLQTLSVTFINTYVDQNYTSHIRLKAELSGLGQLTNLTKLYLGQFGDMDDNSMAWLANCVNLEELAITDSSMNSVQGLADLSKLRTMTVNGNKIRDFSPVVSKASFRGVNSNTFFLPTQFIQADSQEPLIDLHGLINIGDTFGSAVITKFSSFDNFDVHSCKVADGLVNATLKIKGLQEVHVYNWKTGKKDLKTLGTIVPYQLNVNDGKPLKGYAVVPIGKIVTYDDNYSGGQMQSMKYEPFEYIQNIIPKERAGYAFAGWYQDQAGTAAFDFQARTDTNITLYAKWKKKQSMIEAKNSVIYVGDNWEAADNFVFAKDENGQEIRTFDPKKIQVSGEVDVHTAGEYPVTYRIDGAETTVTVTVKPDNTAIMVKDSTLKVGDQWTAKDNFVSWEDRTGKKYTSFDSEKIRVEGTVDTSKPGKYPVVYRINGVSAVANITVIDKDSDKAQPDAPVKPDKQVDDHSQKEAKIEQGLPQAGDQADGPWGMAGFILVIMGLTILVKNRKN